MTRDRGIVGIFRKKRHFSKVLIVWGARLQALIVWGAIQKESDSLEGYIVFFPTIKVVDVCIDNNASSIILSARTKLCHRIY
jgi:hypothetical protein